MAEERRVCYDSDLKIEAYQFQGLMQKFPNHFHDHYVVGFIESGKRHLSCKNRDYILVSGDMLLLNPRENHECEQVDERGARFPLPQHPRGGDGIGHGGDHRQPPATRIFRAGRAPGGGGPAPAGGPRADHGGQRRLCQGGGVPLPDRAVVGRYAQPAAGRPEAENAGVQRVRAFVDAHYAEPVSLDELAKAAGMNKFVLLRASRGSGASPPTSTC